MTDIYLESEEEMKEFLTLDKELLEDKNKLIESLLFHMLVTARNAAMEIFYNDKIVSLLKGEDLINFRK